MSALSQKLRSEAKELQKLKYEHHRLMQDFSGIIAGIR